MQIMKAEGVRITLNERQLRSCLTEVGARKAVEFPKLKRQLDACTSEAIRKVLKDEKNDGTIDDRWRLVKHVAEEVNMLRDIGML